MRSQVRFLLAPPRSRTGRGVVNGTGDGRSGEQKGEQRDSADRTDLGGIALVAGPAVEHVPRGRVARRQPVERTHWIEHSPTPRQPSEARRGMVAGRPRPGRAPGHRHRQLRRLHPVERLAHLPRRRDPLSCTSAPPSAASRHSTRSFGTSRPAWPSARAGVVVWRCGGAAGHGTVHGRCRGRSVRCRVRNPFASHSTGADGCPCSTKALARSARRWGSSRAMKWPASATLVTCAVGS